MKQLVLLLAAVCTCVHAGVLTLFQFGFTLQTLVSKRSDKGWQITNDVKINVRRDSSSNSHLLKICRFVMRWQCITIIPTVITFCFLFLYFVHICLYKLLMRILLLFCRMRMLEKRICVWNRMILNVFSRLSLDFFGYNYQYWLLMCVICVVWYVCLWFVEDLNRFHRKLYWYMLFMYSMHSFDVVSD